MNDAHGDPPRWRDGIDQADVAERAAGHAFRLAEAVPPRTAPSLARVATRIRSSRQPRRLAWIAATAALLLGFAAAASAARLNLVPAWLARLLRPEAGTPTREARPRVKAGPAKPALSTQPAPSAPSHGGPNDGQGIPAPTRSSPATTGLLVSQVRGRWPARKAAQVELDELAHPTARTLPNSATPRSETGLPPEAAWPASDFKGAPRPEEEASSVRPAPPVAPAAAPPLPKAVPGTVQSSTRADTHAMTVSPQVRSKPGAAMYLTETIRLLRAEHEPATALRYLDGHNGELVKGGFGHEAFILRVEALLALGRRDEALRLLDAVSLTDATASGALLVTRGELRAAANRCSEGIGDFDLVLARSKPVDRQALTGRALCRKQLHDIAGMRADVQRLRKEFPNDALPTDLTSP